MKNRFISTIQYIAIAFLAMIIFGVITSPLMALAEDNVTIMLIISQLTIIVASYSGYLFITRHDRAGANEHVKDSLMFTFGYLKLLKLLLIASLALVVNVLISTQIPASEPSGPQLTSLPTMTLFIATVIVAPLIEEFSLRYLPYKIIEDNPTKLNKILYVLITSVIFGLLHYNPSQPFSIAIFSVITTGIVGATAATVFLYTENPIDLITIHAAYNLFVLSLTLL